MGSRPVSLDLGAGINLEMVLVPPGIFMMGSPKGEKDRSNDEELREVVLTIPYYIAKFPVTQEQFTQVMDVTNPSWFSSLGGGKDAVLGLDTKRFPVEQVSWVEAVAFCEQLAKHGQGKFTTFRLPTEAEWEYACRAGTRTPFSFGTTLNGTEANCDGTNPYETSNKGPYLKRTCEVGTYAANALGLYDMHGNVWEWCKDWYREYDFRLLNPIGPGFGSGRVYRGGSWIENPCYCRSACRAWYEPQERGIDLGFRPALVISNADETP